MKHIIKYILMLSTLLFLGSCSKDFLDKKQNGVLDESAIYASVDGINLGVIGTYSSLNYLPTPLTTLDMDYVVFGSIASDDAEAGGEAGGGDFPDIQDVDKGTVQPSESKGLSDHFWGYSYKTILRANSTLNGIKQYRSSNKVSALDDLTLKQYEGEMDFILAFTHFKLVQVYGGVPIADHIFTDSEYKTTKRDSISRCLHFIEGLLTKASFLLPLQYVDADMGRVTKGAAQALLAKAYLYEASYAENYPGDARFSGCGNTYNKALIYADSVINSNEYKLVGIDGEKFNTYWDSLSSPIYPNGTPGYRYIFSPNGRNSKESVFEVQSMNDHRGFMITRGTYLTIYTTVRNYNGTTLGWGFNCPTQDLLNAYEPGDPRKIVSIGITGDPVYYETGAPNFTPGWGTINCKQSPTNMIGRKFEASFSQYWNHRSTDGSSPVDYPYIRYADVVLMAAEASVKTSQNLPLSGLTPTQLVNMIRKRARNDTVSTVPADLASVTFDEIVKERRLELAMEGQRFFDLVRWKKQSILTGIPLQNFLNGSPQASPVSCQFTPGKNDFEPIPLVEIINSGNSLEQYPGW
jgi:starch-binding outer membrane protein, SusD/RagB family